MMVLKIELKKYKKQRRNFLIIKKKKKKRKKKRLFTTLFSIKSNLFNVFTQHQ